MAVDSLLRPARRRARRRGGRQRLGADGLPEGVRGVGLPENVGIPAGRNAGVPHVARRAPVLPRRRRAAGGARHAGARRRDVRRRPASGWCSCAWRPPTAGGRRATGSRACASATPRARPVTRSGRAPWRCRARCSSRSAAGRRIPLRPRGRRPRLARDGRRPSRALRGRHGGAAPVYAAAPHDYSPTTGRATASGWRAATFRCPLGASTCTVRAADAAAAVRPRRHLRAGGARLSRRHAGPVRARAGAARKTLWRMTRAGRPPVI